MWCIENENDVFSEEFHYFMGDDSINIGKSSQLGMNGFDSLHNLTWPCYQNEASWFDTDFISQIKLTTFPLIHSFELLGISENQTEFIKLSSSFDYFIQTFNNFCELNVAWWTPDSKQRWLYFHSCPPPWSCNKGNKYMYDGRRHQYRLYVPYPPPPPTHIPHPLLSDKETSTFMRNKQKHTLSCATFHVFPMGIIFLPF